MKTVLVVEDDTETRELLGELLSSEGYDVYAAPDGLAGLDALRSGGVAFALLDLLMPRMNGLDLVRVVRRDALLDLHRIVITTALRGVPCPPDIRLLHKPFNLDILLGMIHESLRHRISAIYPKSAAAAGPGLARVAVAPVPVSASAPGQDRADVRVWPSTRPRFR